ncbi:hypothetical protein QBZ16_001555 [Prototheca wickerhamii]|uniref:SBP-type domain-containing protein n=1 Tax=Prototheca wickerhamii TaxID=3111 RepID=A0AAD9ID88_PROWI|nr:hypothetical protein QBZ16_001555 [Prototheca wickerhamii]
MDFHRDGELVRFCQRCGLAHPLADFDGQRRSCRKQLEKHNARRRKKEGAASKSASDRAASPSEPPSSRSHSGSPLPAKSEVSGSSHARTHDERVSAAPVRPLSPLGSEGLTGVPSRRRQRATNGNSLSPLADPVGALPDNPLASSSSEGMVEELSAWISDCLSEDALCDGVVDGGAVAPFLLDEVDAWGDLGAYALRAPAGIDGALAGRRPARPVRAWPRACLPRTRPPRARMTCCCCPAPRSRSLAPRPPTSPPTSPSACAAGAPRRPSTSWARRLTSAPAACTSRCRPACRRATRGRRPQRWRPWSRVGAWWAGSALVQVASAMVLIQAGAPVQRWTLRGPGQHRLVPGVLEVTPPVLSVQGERERRGADPRCACAASTCCRTAARCCAGCRARLRPRASPAPTARARAGGAGDDAFEARCCGCCVARLAEAGQKSCCGARAPAREQSAVLELARPLAAPGVLHVSAQAGPYVSPAASCLVVETEAEAAELRAWLRATSEPTGAVLRALGAVNEYVGAPPGKLRRAAVLERAAARLVFWALRRGLAAVARAALHALARMVESATAASLAGAAPAARRPAPSGDGLSLLHAVPAATGLATLRLARALGAPRPGLSLVAAAVQSRDSSVLEQVLGWDGVVRMQLAEHAEAELAEALESIAREEAGDDDGPVPESGAARTDPERKGGAAQAPSAQSPCCASRVHAPPTSSTSSACAEEMARLLRSAGLLSDDQGPHLRPPKAITSARLRTRPGEPDSIVAPATPTRCACMGSCPCARRLAGSCCSGGPRGCGQGSGACPCCDDAASPADALRPPCCSGSQELRRVAATD